MDLVVEVESAAPGYTYYT